MRLSEKKVALTSVAYAVALVAVASVATTQAESTKAQAVSVVYVPAETGAKLRTVVPTMTKDVVIDLFRGSKQQLAPIQLADLLESVGFTGNNLKIAWAVAMRESNGRPMAHNKNHKTGDDSYGIFQINMLGPMGQDRRVRMLMVTNNDLYDPVRNAEVAYYMSGGDDFSAWGIGKNAYRDRNSSIANLLKQYPGTTKSNAAKSKHKSK